MTKILLSRFRWISMFALPLCITIALVPPLRAQTPQEQTDHQEPEDEEDEVEKAKDEPDKGSPVEVHYKDGLRLASKDGKFAARIRWRAQSRLTDVTSDEDKLRQSVKSGNVPSGTTKAQ